MSETKKVKQLKLNDMGGSDRESLINYFTLNYKANLEKGSLERQKKNLGVEDSGQISTSQQQIDSKMIGELVKRHGRLSALEQRFIINTLIQICKEQLHPTNYPLALILGYHLMPSSVPLIDSKFDDLIEKVRKEQNNERLMIALQLSFRHILKLGKLLTENSKFGKLFDQIINGIID